jgi:predicted transcriptional regulator
MGANNPTNCVNCFKALGVSTKLELYTYLKNHKSATVGNLVSVVSLKQPTVSYHLKDMQQSGLLTSTKVGKEVYYSVNPVCPIHKSECVFRNVQF